jgi:hypothetical protein
MEKSRIRDKHPGSATLLSIPLARAAFFDADHGWEKFGSGMEKIPIRDKHPASATPIGTVLHEVGT